MKVFTSIFNPKSKCFECNSTFGLQRRRECLHCSKNYTESLFCKNCSIKIKESNKLFKAKRYCNKCYESSINPIVETIEIQPSSLISQSEVIKNQFSLKLKEAKIIEDNPENHYKLLKTIGEGSSSLVYLSESLKTNEKFAIKRVLITNSAHKEQIINEIMLSLMSANKNIIQIVEAYEYNFSF